MIHNLRTWSLDALTSLDATVDHSRSFPVPLPSPKARSETPERHNRYQARPTLSDKKDGLF